MNFDIVKLNYDKGAWNLIQVKICVRKGIITPEQFTEITGKSYK